MISYMQLIYKDQIINNEDLFFVLDRYEKLWAKINYIIKNKANNIIEYIRGFKDILQELIEYKKIVDIYIAEFKTEPVSDEMVDEKKNLISVVEGLISEGKSDEALEILNQLNDIFMYDKDILLARGVTLYLLNRNKEALMDLSEAYLVTEGSFDVTYNIACILETEGEKERAKHYFRESLNKCEDEHLREEIRAIIGENND